MPTLNWLNRDAAFRTAEQVPYRLLDAVSQHGDGSRMVYGEACTLGAPRLQAEDLRFRQIPYELAGR